MGKPSIANVFTAAHNESIEAVSFWLEKNKDVTYSIDIYTDVTGSTDPTAGTKHSVATNEMTDLPGYYTVPLTTPISVRSGSKFSVVLTCESNHLGAMIFPLDVASTYPNYYNFHAVSAAGQSFYRESASAGSWVDQSANNGGNFRIKAFTSGALVSSIAVDSPANYVTAGNNLQMTATASPAKAADKTVTWSVSDETKATIDPDSGLLASVAAGTVTVTATANDGSGTTGSKEITITATDPLADNYAVTVDLAGVSTDPTIWIDGTKYDGEDLFVSGTKSTKVLGDDTAKCVTAYTYNDPNETDPHKQYPTAMTVWALNYDETAGKYVSTRVSGLDNLLQYSGSSIRITGEKGIRMITSVDSGTKAALIAAGLSGYTLLEYGTVVAWWIDNLQQGARPLVLTEGEDENTKYTKSAYAYKRGVSDPVFNYSGNLVQYTNVLVGFSNEQCIPDLAMRPYAILQGPDGKQVTIYGGVIRRSIGYIAYQNRNAFAPGTAAYNYIWGIINYVEQNQ